MGAIGTPGRDQDATTGHRERGTGERGREGGRETRGPWDREEGYTAPIVNLVEAGGPGGGVPKGVRRVRGGLLGVNGMGRRIP